MLYAHGLEGHFLVEVLCPFLRGPRGSLQGGGQQDARNACGKANNQSVCVFVSCVRYFFQCWQSEQAGYGYVYTGKS